MNQIETERLIISELTVSDAPFILELLNSPGWLRFIGDRGVKSIEDAEQYLINGPIASYTNNGFGLWLVQLKSTEVPIGMCGLIKRDTLEDVDIGFALLPEYGGQGYAYESASAVLNHGYNHLGLKKIVAITLPDNNHSINLLRKIGLNFEKMIQFNNEELMLFANIPS